MKGIAKVFKMGFDCAKVFSSTGSGGMDESSWSPACIFCFKLSWSCWVIYFPRYSGTWISVPLISSFYLSIRSLGS